MKMSLGVVRWFVTISIGQMWFHARSTCAAWFLTCSKRSQGLSCAMPSAQCVPRSSAARPHKPKRGEGIEPKANTTHLLDSRVSFWSGCAGSALLETIGDLALRQMRSGKPTNGLLDALPILLGGRSCAKSSEEWSLTQLGLWNLGKPTWLVSLLVSVDHKRVTGYSGHARGYTQKKKKKTIRENITLSLIMS